MMSSLRTWSRLLPGDHGILPRGMLLHSADDGRRLYLGLCNGIRRRWSPEWAFRHSKPGFSSVCQEQIASALDVHMINAHLELGQLWRCPVDWCTIWKGSVSDCLEHLQDKHGGSQYVALKNIAKFFPPWTVPQDLWMTALRPDVSGIAVDAHTSIVSTRTHFPIWHSGGSTVSAVFVHVSGYGHRGAHASAHFHSCVGGAPRAGAGEVFSTWRYNHGW